MIKYIIIAIVILVSSCQRTIILTEQQKNADAVYLLLNEEFNLYEDGVQKYVNSSKLLLQTHASFNRLFGDVHINYDPNFQKVNVVKAETDNSMGKSVVKENAINDMLPKHAQRSGYFNNLRTKVVSHMGTEIGAIINFEYNIESKVGYKPGLFENIIIGKFIPVKDYNLVINVPKGKRLYYQLLNSDVNPVIADTEKGKRYTWHFDNIPALMHEKGEPKYRSDLVRLVFSSISEKECMKIVSNSGMFNEEDTTIARVSNKLVKDIKPDLQKILKLNNEVNNNIAFNNISFKQASYRGRNPGVIWHDLNASAHEKTCLLVDMLNAINIKAQIVVSVPNQLVKHAKVNPDVWQDFYVYIDSINSGILLKTTEENFYSRHLELNGYSFYNPTSNKIINIPKVKSFISSSMKVNMNSRKKIWGEAEVKTSGICSHTLRKSDKKYFKNLMTSSMNYKEQKNGDLLYYIEDKAKIIDEDYLFISLPRYNVGIESFYSPILIDNRNGSLKIKAPVEEKYNYLVSYNKKFRIINKSVDINIENKVGKVVIKIMNDLNNVEIERYLLINKSIINIGDYHHFKELIDIWSDKNYSNLYFTNAN